MVNRQLFYLITTSSNFISISISIAIAITISIRFYRSVIGLYFGTSDFITNHAIR